MKKTSRGFQLPRRVIALGQHGGATWMVYITKMGDTYETSFAVDHQSFSLMQGDDDEAKQRSRFIADAFITVLRKLLPASSFAIVKTKPARKVTKTKRGAPTKQASRRPSRTRHKAPR